MTWLFPPSISVFVDMNSHLDLIEMDLKSGNDHCGRKSLETAGEVEEKELGFPQFNLLPVEIQIMIWHEAAACHARILHLESRIGAPMDSTPYCMSLHHGIFRVSDPFEYTFADLDWPKTCHLAREAALKKTSRISMRKKKGIRINRSAGIFHCDFRFCPSLDIVHLNVNIMIQVKENGGFASLRPRRPEPRRPIRRKSFLAGLEAVETIAFDQLNVRDLTFSFGQRKLNNWCFLFSCLPRVRKVLVSSDEPPGVSSLESRWRSMWNGRYVLLFGAETVQAFRDARRRLGSEDGAWGVLHETHPDLKKKLQSFNFPEDKCNGAWDHGPSRMVARKDNSFEIPSVPVFVPQRPVEVPASPSNAENDFSFQQSE